MIKKSILNAILKDVHQNIDISATQVVDKFENTEMAYPPGVELTAEEKAALSLIYLSDFAKSGLKKLIADACSTPLFHLFCQFDGVGDPSIELDEVWLGIRLTQKKIDDEEPEEEFLHDDFFETSWLYKDWTKEWQTK